MTDDQFVFFFHTPTSKDNVFVFFFLIKIKTKTQELDGLDTSDQRDRVRLSHSGTLSV
jgi:hypothetical protein